MLASIPIFHVVFNANSLENPYDPFFLSPVALLGLIVNGNIPPGTNCPDSRFFYSQSPKLGPDKISH